MSATPRYRRAIGLHYQAETDAAPGISIKGDALDADQIVQLARRYGIPVIEKPQVVQALDSFETGEFVPERLYRAVAVILADLERRWRRR